MDAKSKRGNDGPPAFTLVELLVVIAVIGILIGLVSALLGGMSDRVLDMQAKDLCSQTAEAWALVASEYSRLPSQKLVEGIVDCEKLESGSSAESVDVCFKMTPAAADLLDSWPPGKYCSPIPARDYATYQTGKTNDTQVGFCPRVRKGTYPEYEDAVEFDYDYGRLELDMSMRRFGVCAPWLVRKLRDAASEEGVGSGTIETMSKESALELLSANKFGHGVVTVALDLSGDGKILVPKGLLDNGDVLELRATAVAWVWNERKTKTLRSW